MKTYRHISSLLLACTLILGLTSCEKDEDKTTSPTVYPKVISWNGIEKPIVSAKYYFSGMLTNTLFRLSSSAKNTASAPDQYCIDLEIPNDWLNNPRGVNLNYSSNWKMTVYAAGTSLTITASGANETPAVVSGTFYAIGGSGGIFKMKVTTNLRVHDDELGYDVAIPLNFSYEGTMTWDENLDTTEEEDPDF